MSSYDNQPPSHGYGSQPVPRTFPPAPEQPVPDYSQSGMSGTYEPTNQYSTFDQPGQSGQSGQPGQPGQSGQSSPYDQQDQPTAVFGEPRVGSYPVAPRKKSGPGWGGVIAIAAIAALLAGGIGAGAATGVQSLMKPTTTSAQETSTSNDNVQTTEVPDWVAIASQAAQSVVAIQVGRDGQIRELGSGFVYEPQDGDKLYIVTNNHVVADGDTPNGTIQAVFRSGATVDASIVGRDPETDVAVLEMKDQPRDTKALPVGDSNALKVGEPVMALGNPLGLADTVTTGIVSALNRPVATSNPGQSNQQNVATITNAIQTDAAINPGNSGGPLVNGAGKVIGVNSSAAALQGSADSGQTGSIGIGFAIPISQATYIADQLINTGTAKHPFLGVQITSGEVTKSGVTVGSAAVSAVENQSPAAAAGIRQGDHIVAVDDTPVNGAVSLQALVRSKRGGDQVKLTIVRGGQPTDVTVTLDVQ